MHNANLVNFHCDLFGRLYCKRNDDLNFRSWYKKGEGFSYVEFTATITTIILGTFGWCGKLAFIIIIIIITGKTMYVITRTERPRVGKTRFYTADLTELVGQLKNEEGKNISCDGTTEIINELLKFGLSKNFNFQL